MELESTTTIREKIRWMEDRPISWDKNQAWMRIERGGAKEESTRKVGYYAAAAVVMMAIAMIVSGDYTRDAAIGGNLLTQEANGKAGSAEGISNIERPRRQAGREYRISNVEVEPGIEGKCEEVRTTHHEKTIWATQIVTPEINEEIAEPFVLMPEPFEGERIAIVENPKIVAPPVERVHAIFGVEQEPSVALIRQGKKLKIYFLQSEISQSSYVNIVEPSSLEARINKK
jgi:hypothetical protein